MTVLRLPSAAATSEVPAGTSRPRSAARVFLHVGEPKTGTTFLQQVMWRNRDRLAAAGVVLPGHHPQDHFRATLDLRGLHKKPNDPAGTWQGEWDVLAAQARGADTAVVSHELFAAADRDQIARAARSLAATELHVVLTVRDMATLVPAEWQETVKHRNTKPWREWVDHLVDREAGDPNRRRFWFWKVHDTLGILEDWSRFVPPERLHVVTVPPSGAPRDTLWRRFAAVLGIDPASVDLTRARSNSSLGLPETEFLRLLNEQLADEVPPWFYMARVKEPLAHGVLSHRTATDRLVLPPERLPWASDEARRLIAGLRSGGYDVVGDLGDLLPREVSGTDRVQPSDAELLSAAVVSAAELVRDQYRRTQPAVRPQPVHPPDGWLPARIEAAAARSPRLKNALRALSSRSATARRLRVLIWRTADGRRR